MLGRIELELFPVARKINLLFGRDLVSIGSVIEFNVMITNYRIQVKSVSCSAVRIN